MSAKQSKPERIEQMVQTLFVRQKGATRSLYDLAVVHADEWVSDAQPPKGGLRGGSTSPVVAEEQSEDRAVSRMALNARKSLVARMNAAEAELAALLRDVVRFTATVDASKLPPDPESYCKNHMTANLHEDVTAHAPKSGLCGFCYESKRTYGFLPPVEILTLHSAGERIRAGRELAELARLRAKGTAA